MESLCECSIESPALMSHGVSKLVKSTGNRPLGRLRGSWEDNIRMDLKEICVNTRNWVDSAQNRDYYRARVNAAMNLRLP